MSSLVLSISKDREPTNYLPGQCVSILSHPHSKNSFLMFRGNLCFSLYPLPLILSLDTTAFSLQPPFRHLYTLMRSLWVLFSLRWTVPALPHLLQYLSQSQWPFAGLHPVVSFLSCTGKHRTSHRKKKKKSLIFLSNNYFLSRHKANFFCHDPKWCFGSPFLHIQPSTSLSATNSTQREHIPPFSRTGNTHATLAGKV